MTWKVTMRTFKAHLVTVLLTTFVVLALLKLTRVIDWWWVVVATPLWLPILVAIVASIALGSDKGLDTLLGERTAKESEGLDVLDQIFDEQNPVSYGETQSIENPVVHETVNSSWEPPYPHYVPSYIQHPPVPPPPTETVVPSFSYTSPLTHVSEDAYVNEGKEVNLDESAGGQESEPGFAEAAVALDDSVKNDPANIWEIPVEGRELTAKRSGWSAEAVQTADGKVVVTAIRNFSANISPKASKKVRTLKDALLATSSRDEKTGLHTWEGRTEASSPTTFLSVASGSPCPNIWREKDINHN